MLSPWPLKLILDCLILDKPLPDEVVLLQAIRDTDPKLLLLILALAIVVLAVLKASFLCEPILALQCRRPDGCRCSRTCFCASAAAVIVFSRIGPLWESRVSLDSDMKEMKGILIDLPQEFVRRLVTFGAYAAVMLALDWRLSLLSALCRCSTLYQILWRRHAKRPEEKRVQEGAVAQSLLRT